MGRWSVAMGLAPLLSMPVTRRAPFPAIALWPGKPRKKSKKGESVSFGDIPSPFEGTEHGAALSASTDRTRELMGLDDPEQGPWRSVAFCLSPEAAAHLPR